MKETKTNPPAFCLRATPFGPVAILWSPWRGRPKISQILISHPDISAPQAIAKFFPDAGASSCGEIDIFTDRIEALLNGEDIQFSIDALRLDLCTPFQQRILQADQAIPRGRAGTYRSIAEQTGNPRGARAVGTAQATNPFPIAIPCHRVIRSDGSLGGYGGGREMKRALLEKEGVAFRDAGRVAHHSIWKC